MAVSDSAIRNSKPIEKPYKIYDDGGLFLLISPAGGKLWRLKYRYGGKEKLLSFGGYPDVSLKDARERRDAARKLLAADIDPGAEKKRKAVAAIGSIATSGVGGWHGQASHHRSERR